MVDAVAMSVDITGVFGQGRPVAPSFNKFIGFGDSNIDSGYFFTHIISTNATLETQYKASVKAGGGIPTSLGGKMNSVLLAADYGLTAIPVGEPGGTNYAASGATVTGALPNSQAPSITSQIQTYLAHVNNHADPNAIYLISGGGNDAKIAEGLSGTAVQDAYMIQQANALAAALEQLHAAGAKYIVIGDHSGPGVLGQIFTDTLRSDLATAGVPFIPANINENVIQAVDADPAAFGITNTIRPSAAPPFPANGGADVNPLPDTIPASWALFATQLVSPGAGKTYLWADDEHLSAAGQKIEAKYLHHLIQNADPTVSETLTAQVNIVGNSTTNFTYQWERLAPGQTTWTDIGGATNSTYVVQKADLGAELRVEVTYTDINGQQLTEFSQIVGHVAAHHAAALHLV
jgi:outer membrane lipase/esterase